jgi:hypothetical protein
MALLSRQENLPLAADSGDYAPMQLVCLALALALLALALRIASIW